MSGYGKNFYFGIAADTANASVFSLFGAGCFFNGFPFAKIMINYFKVYRYFFFTDFANRRGYF